MTVVIDTSVLVGFLHRGDPHHEAAQQLMRRILRGELGAPVSCDYVLGEGLNVLRKRARDRQASRALAEFFFGEPGKAPPLTTRLIGRAELEASMALHFEHYERALSFTDCVLAVLARSLNAPIASFDADFDGIVARVQ